LVKNFFMAGRDFIFAAKFLCTRALKSYFLGIFNEFPIFKVKSVRAYMIKFEKYAISAFNGKESINLDKKERSYKKNENAHEIRKKKLVYVPPCIT